MSDDRAGVDTPPTETTPPIDAETVDLNQVQPLPDATGAGADGDDLTADPGDQQADIDDGLDDTAVDGCPLDPAEIVPASADAHLLGATAGVSFGSYDPRRFGWTADRSQIVGFTWRGQSFPAGVHRLAAPVFTAFLEDMLAQGGFGPAGYHNPGDWGYFYRAVRGGGLLSFHGYGLAIDIRAPANPYSSSGMPHHSIVDAVVKRVARAHGMEWGGSWSSPVDTMHAEIHRSPAECRAQHPTAPAPTGPPTLRKGSSGAYVVQLQRRLNLQPSAHRGYDDATIKWVRRYQQFHGLATDGVVGPATWAKLLHAPIVVGERRLILHSSGPDVAWLQRKLGLTPSGHPTFGPVTAQAVEALQRRHRLPVNGTVVEHPEWCAAGIWPPR